MLVEINNVRKHDLGPTNDTKCIFQRLNSKVLTLYILSLYRHMSEKKKLPFEDSTKIVILIANVNHYYIMHQHHSRYLKICKKSTKIILA